MLPEYRGRGGIVLGRHDHQRTAIVPFHRELQDFVRPAQLAVDQHGVSAGLAVGFAATQGFVQPPAGNERLDPGHDAEVVILLRILAGLDLAAKTVEIFERLLLTLDEAVGLRKQLVLDAHAGDLALLQLVYQPAHVVEVAVTGVTVEQDRNTGRVGHEFERVHHLRPAQLIVVTNRMLCRQRQPGSPDAAESRFFDDARREAVVGLENEFSLVAAQ